MHSVSSKDVLIRFKLTSLIFLLLFLMLPLVIGSLLYGFYTNNTAWMKYAGIFSAACVIFKGLSYMIGARLKCSLCMAAPLGNLGYPKHRSARTLCGSHRMAVSTSILFMGNFRCPYCGESTGMRVRDRSDHRNFFRWYPGAVGIAPSSSSVASSHLASWSAIALFFNSLLLVFLLFSPPI